MSDRVQVLVDTDLCVGSTMCVGLAPDALELGDETHPMPRAASLELTEELREAVEGCPVQALRLEPVD